MDLNYLYWVYVEGLTDIFSEGYVGFTNNPDRRLKEHIKAGRVPPNSKMMVLEQGNFETIRTMEFFLRPERNIGWNKAPGGQGGMVWEEHPRGTLGMPPWNKGIPWAQETRDKIAVALTGKKETKEHRENISKGLSGVPKSEIHKLRLSEAIARQDMTCPYCFRKGKAPSMHRHVSACERKIA